jgi:hypothetical protein
MIKKALLSRKCRKLSMVQQADHPTYLNATSIGILYNSDEFEKELIEELSDSFSGDGKETASLAYASKESEDKFSFCKKDISISGELKKESVGFFTNRVFDFLVSLNTSEDINFKYVLALSKASCKIGISSDPLDELLVLSIKQTEDKAQNISDIIKYLKKI